jgi:hypothetical protein
MKKCSRCSTILDIDYKLTCCPDCRHLINSVLTFSKGLKCERCGDRRSDRSDRWCRGCVKLLRATGQMPGWQGGTAGTCNRTTDWFWVDGIKTRYHGDEKFFGKVVNGVGPEEFRRAREKSIRALRQEGVEVLS